MRQGTVVSIGTFDGVHLGHQAILHELCQQATARALPSLIYAFSTPPRWIEHRDEDRYLLLPTPVKLGLLRKSVGIVHSATFERVQSMDPEEFIETVLLEQLHARVIIEGETFRFGRDRSGDLEILRLLGTKRELDVISVLPVVVEGEVASSTRIRELIRTGDFHTARLCLGRSPMLQGTVVSGDQIGREIGYPTANLSIDPHVLLPLPGIFLIHAYGDDIRSNGLLYVGSRPTIGSGHMRCEVHLLEFPDRPLYDKSLEIHLLEKIRDDRTFSSLDALRSQIEADIVLAQKLLSDYPLIEERISS